MIPERSRILFFGTFDEQRSPRPSILREGLVAHGYDVEDCVIPLGMSSDLRVLIFRRPWLLPIFVVRLLVTWARLVIRSRGHRRPDVVVVGYMAQLDVPLARVRYPRAEIVIDHLVSLAGTGVDRGAPAGVFGRVLAAADSMALRCADIAVVDTPEHLAELPEGHRDKGVVVLVGALEATFAGRQSTIPPGPPPLKVGFCGRYIPLQGAKTIGEAIAELSRRGRDDVVFTMIGRGQDLAACRAATGGATSVRWIDRMVQRDELVTLLSGHHVALGVFGSTAKALKVVPTKTFDGMAMGQAVVTGDTPPQRRELTAGVVFVPPADPLALADALEALADDPARVEQLASDAAALADSRFSARAVVEPLVAVIQRALTAGRLEPRRGARRLLER